MKHDKVEYDHPPTREALVNEINELRARINALQRLVEAHSSQIDILGDRTAGLPRYGSDPGSWKSGGFFDD